MGRAGWPVRALAAWLAAGAGGAWAPAWLAVLLGVVVMAAAERPVGRRAARALADIAVIGVCAALSVPPVVWIPIVTGAAMFTALGLAVDVVVEPIEHRTRVWIYAVPIVGLLGLAVWRIHIVTEWVAHTPFLAAGRAPKEHFVRLGTGANAVVARPKGTGPFPGALLFHADNPEGVRQPSAIVLRRALVGAGYVVVAPDHPGYGDSPLVPDFDALPSMLDAYDQLVRESVTDIIVVGHSMGASDVYRMLAQERPLKAAVVFGSGLRMNPEDARWHRVFVQNRGVTGSLSRDRYERIFSRFYDPLALIGRLPLDHAPVVFVHSELEYPGIAKSRARIFAAFPGEKRTADLANAGHGFSATGRWGVYVADTRVTTDLEALFGSLR